MHTPPAARFVRRVQCLAGFGHSPGSRSFAVRRRVARWTASAPCSDVPQPVYDDRLAGARGRLAIGGSDGTAPGCCRDRLGEARLRLDHLLHDPEGGPSRSSG